ncbi:hypothetical protein [Lichenifustis flavocetrariae]|uniref:Uncharacterized protein n=1 Tax=Lichenifustis flavocetrariae TaxID=2949735 RepID=A0AA41Z6T9_9HYPH|nr:hypothetical protein [Lichenifustis flavocetrariae]MCW6511410.1 hypothetical protein [Lichenifustis flavocetrariae]
MMRRASSQAVQHHPPTNIAKLPGSVLDALLITLPVETAVVGADHTSVSIAQVEAADPGWLFSDISAVDYQKANFTKKAILETQSCVFVIFDAAYRFKDVGTEFLSFEIQQGNHHLTDAIYIKKIALS